MEEKERSGGAKGLKRRIRGEEEEEAGWRKRRGVEGQDTGYQRGVPRNPIGIPLPLHKKLPLFFLGQILAPSFGIFSINVAGAGLDHAEDGGWREKGEKWGGAAQPSGD